MAAACATVSAILPLDCAYIGGVDPDKVYIGNVGTFTPAATSGAISGMVAISSAKLFKVNGVKGSVTVQAEPVGDMLTREKHTLNFNVFSNSAAALLQLNAINNARTFALVGMLDGSYQWVGVGASGSTASNTGLVGGTSMDSSTQAGYSVALMSEDRVGGEISLPPLFVPASGTVADWITANCTVS